MTGSVASDDAAIFLVVFIFGPLIACLATAPAVGD
jgi:hypothetical protein